MFTLKQIEQAHSKVKTGADFPNYIKEIKEMGVIAFETWVIDSHTEYIGKNDYRVKSLPKYDILKVSEISSQGEFLNYLKSHQQGDTDYITFCNHCAETGIEKWIVLLDEMTCTYYDLSGNKILEEKIPVI